MALSAFTSAVRDSLSNLAASLNAGKDKAAGDAFFLYGLDRSQVEAMYRGDWLARKVVDIVPYDMVREWREWAGERPSVAAAEAAERRLNLRKVVQRALTLGRLYGGAAVIVGTGESRPEALAAPLDPEDVGPGDIKFLHVVSRWQLGAPEVNRDPLDPWFGEPLFYEIVAPDRGALKLHPSRVVRFLGNEFPDPSLGLSAWSDSVLQTLYDAIHAVALTTTGATSLMHEAKVDVVTVPNLSEHLSSAATTAQLSARFAYAAAMKSINNLLLLGDGETWARQKIDFGGLPAMVQTFLQVAAGAADIPVTRLLGQSPAGMSATGDSDTRNYYDMVSSRQEIDLRPQLERLDALVLHSAGLDPAALTFEFRPLWQLSASEKASVALHKAQASAVYAGVNLWPASTTAQLVQAQLVEDGIYPNAETIFAEAKAAAAERESGERASSPGMSTPEPSRASSIVTDLGFDPDQPRDPDGRWSGGGSSSASAVPISPGTTDPAGSASMPPHAATHSAEAGFATAAQGPHAPDGTPIDLASSKGRSKALVQAIVAGLGAVARLMERLGISFEDVEPDASEAPRKSGDVPTVAPPSLSQPDKPQTELNRKAQAEDSRIRSDLPDKYIKDDGTLNWPTANNGATDPETPDLLLPNQIVDKYGYPGGSYLAPPGTPFEARSLPYDISKTPLQTYRVLKPISVQKGQTAPWFGEPGGGTQYRTGSDIQILQKEGFLQYLGESYDGK